MNNSNAEGPPAHELECKLLQHMIFTELIDTQKRRRPACFTRKLQIESKLLLGIIFSELITLTELITGIADKAQLLYAHITNADLRSKKNS